MSSLLPTPEPPDPIEGALGHFEHTNWVKASLKALDQGTVHSAGGVAGPLAVEELTIDKQGSEAASIVQKGDGYRAIYGQSRTGTNRCSG